MAEVFVDSSYSDRLALRSGSVSWPQGRREKLSGGSYGAVYSVKMHGFTCIAKRLHDVLREGEVDRTKEGESTVSERFLKECELLSTLYHPNIVQFMGIHKTLDSHGREDVSLIMEGLYQDLDKFVEDANNAKEVLPVSLNLSFLLDVSNALLYLHKHSPPIIHRDVKAANVLLGRDMRAKLADLGTSKLLDFNPLSSTRYTQCPGTLGIMPPEALQSHPKYDTQLDVFSFGTLIIHVVNQEFPLPCEVSRAKKKGELQIAKRQEAIDKIDRGPLLDLTRHCLQDVPSKRPNMMRVRDILDNLSQQHPCNYTTFYDMHKEIEKLNGEVEAAQRWSVRVEKLRRENSQLQLDIQQAMEERDLAATQAAIFKEDFERERRDRERAAGEYDSNLHRLETETEQLRRELQLHKAVRLDLEREMRQLREEEGRRRNPVKKIGSKTVTMPLRRTRSPAGSSVSSHTVDDVLQSLRFDAAEHSSSGQRCGQRYEWFQTPSDVVVEIMVPSVKEEDIVAEFSRRKVKVFIDTGGPPYRLSLHTSHNIVPDKCLMKCLTTKVELRMKKREGVHWATLDERGATPKTSDDYFHKWDSILEDDDDDN